MEFLEQGGYGKIWECSDIEYKKSRYGDSYQYYLYLTNGKKTKSAIIGKYNVKNILNPNTIFRITYFPPNFITLNNAKKLEIDHKEFYSNIIRGYISEGMDEDEVNMAIGLPKTENKSSRGSTQWVYDSYDTDIKYVYFKNGKVTSYQSSSSY